MESSRSFQVIRRGQVMERINLTETMDRIKTTIDPIRDAQIRRYAAILASAQADANYLRGDFVRPVDSLRRTAFFGDIRRYRYIDGSTEISQHWGVDFGIPSGTPVYAPARGKVVLAENRISTGWTVILEHLPGMFTIYMHLSRLKVLAGQVVEANQRLGESGATGFATGPHLHWELRINCVAADPEALLGLPAGNHRFLP
jgi:murein DD-endopeptidase MepM/ murein hydrolase activator NlpD